MSTDPTVGGIPEETQNPADLVNQWQAMHKAVENAGLVFNRVQKGNLYTHENGVSVTCVDIGTFYPITGLENGLKYRCVLDGTNGKITPDFKGEWTCGYTISFSSNKTADVHAELFKSGVVVDSVDFRRDISASGAFGCAVGFGMIETENDDYLEVRLASSASNTVLSVDHMSFFMMRTG